MADGHHQGHRGPATRRGSFLWVQRPLVTVWVRCTRFHEALAGPLWMFPLFTGMGRFLAQFPCYLRLLLQLSSDMSVPAATPPKTSHSPLKEWLRRGGSLLRAIFPLRRSATFLPIFSETPAHCLLNRKAWAPPQRKFQQTVRLRHGYCLVSDGLHSRLRHAALCRTLSAMTLFAVSLTQTF